MTGPSEANYQSALYNLAKRNQSKFYVFTVLGFLYSALISIFSKTYREYINDPNIVLFTILFSLVFVGLGYYFQNMSKVRHAQAEKFRKSTFINDALKSKFNHDINKHIERLGDKLYKLACKEQQAMEKKEAESNNDKKEKEAEDEYYTALTSTEGRILECIQQNCFQASSDLDTYYDELSRKWLPWFIIFILVPGIILIVLIINSLDGAFDFSQVFISFVTVYFSFDFFRYYYSFKKEGEQLDRLEKEIGFVKETVQLPEMMYFFSEYITLLEVKPMVPYWCYLKNKAKVNEKWRAKIDYEKRAREQRQ